MGYSGYIFSNPYPEGVDSLDELIIEGHPCDLCVINDNTVGVAVYNPGCVHVAKVRDESFLYRLPPLCQWVNTVME